MFNPLRSLVRILGFCRKEILEVARQPKLMLAVVLGPLMILLLFGIGYRTPRKPLRTLFLTKQNDPISAEISKFLPLIGKQFDVQGITHDPEKARLLLRQKEVDVVVVVPPNAAEAISRNEQAVCTFIHDEMNPEQSDYIRLTGEVLVNELNHHLLDSVVATQRKQLQLDIQTSIQTIRALRAALEQQDLTGAGELQTSLNSILEGIAHSLRSRIESSEATENDASREILFTMAGVLAKTHSSLVPENKKRNYAEEILQSTNVENDLMVLSAQVQNLKSLDSQLMLAPFSSKTEGIGKTQPRLADYFSPAILILLLQHLAILFAAISLVREFNGGKAEILRVSPLRNAELLLGKFIGCMILCAFAAALLTVVLVYGLQLPIMGDWRELIAILGAVLFCSLAIGFVISTLSYSEEYAILYSMLLFIVSMFFSGFFLDLDMLWRPLLVISYALPATYGIGLIQDVLLRGDPAGQLSIALLVILGLAFSLAASILSRRRLSVA